MNYPTFKDVEYEPLRFFNICSTIFNIEEELGKNAKREYLSLLNKEEKVKTYFMLNYIISKGYGEVKKETIKEAKLNVEG